MGSGGLRSSGGLRWAPEKRRPYTRWWRGTQQRQQRRRHVGMQVSKAAMPVKEDRTRKEIAEGSDSGRNLDWCEGSLEKVDAPCTISS